MKRFFLTAIMLVLFFTAGFAQVLKIEETASGAAYLTKDPVDGFFDLVNPIDIAIQLKDSSMNMEDRSAALDDYRKSFYNEVLSPTEEEKAKLHKIFDELFENCNNLNPSLLPDTIRLIVVKGDHYGSSTFYTRGNAIVTSRNSLNKMELKNFKLVMYHELSHIILRYHAPLRHELYSLIGFTEIKADIEIAENFKKQILYNPDGVNIHYGIDIAVSEEESYTFIPVIFSLYESFKSETPTFFGYLNFKLLPIEKSGSGFRLMSPEETSNWDYGKIMQKYFEKITMNTQYIIHPDEIIADNFMYLFREESENQDLDSQLLNEIKKKFKAYK